MNKALIFDLGGVLIDDERMWEDRKQAMYPKVLGEDAVPKMGSTIGVNIEPKLQMSMMSLRV